LRQGEFECADGHVGHLLERATGDSGFADERRADQMHRGAVALQDDDQLWEFFAAVADEVSGAFETYRQYRCGCLRVTHDRRWRAGRRIRVERCDGARLLQCRQPRWELLWQVHLDLRYVRVERSCWVRQFDRQASTVSPRCLAVR